MSKIWIKGVTWLCLAASVLMVAPERELKEASTLLHKTLEALHRALRFFDREHRTVNLDAIIGTRIVEGTLKTLLKHIDYDQDAWPLDSATIDVIRELQTLATDVSDNALSFIEAADPVYYRRIGPLIQRGFWDLDFASKDVSGEAVYRAWIPQPGEALQEVESDNCITEILGTGPNTKAKCHISAPCWKKMTKTGYSGYSLTHQVFYLQIAYQMGCMEEMNKQRTLLGQPPPSELVDRFCAATFLEARSIATAGFPGIRRDLFMEQAALCGMMGFRSFFTEDWLHQILSWQDNQAGCYKGETIRESQVEYRETKTPESGVSRVKREERELPDGCLCHMTTVAAGALSLYVRYIAEYQQMVFERTQVFNKTT